jgi:hypothetical protein
MKDSRRWYNNRQAQATGTVLILRKNKYPRILGARITITVFRESMGKSICIPSERIMPREGMGKIRIS